MLWQGEHEYEKVLAISVGFEKILATGVDVVTQVCLW